MQYECPEQLKHQRLVALDIETTGLSIMANNIIELGVVEVVDGVLKTKYSRLFGGGRSSVYLTRKIHEIRDVERQGKQTFRECCPRIAQWLDDAVIVTHNGAKFDMPFIRQKMDEVGVTLNISGHYDTYLICKSIKRDVLDGNGNPMLDEKGKHVQEPVYEKHSLEYMCGRFGIPYDESNHRGLTDCICTLDLLYALFQKHGQLQMDK